MTMAEVIRRMRCPFCGHEIETKSVGVVHCGPHEIAPGKYKRARAMFEMTDKVDNGREAVTLDQWARAKAK